MTFKIAEVNMDRLRKKVNRIKNKCIKYGNDFTYEEVGECFEEIDNPKYNPFDLSSDEPQKITIKKIIVKVEGTAILNNWHMVASVEKLNNGNVFKKATDEEVPERYYNSNPVCEHCNTKRIRKMTYIIRNNESGEFKQVGGNCLCDFIHGRSAESIAEFISLFDTLIEYESVDSSSGSIPYYYKTEQILIFAAEVIRLFGYVKANYEDGSPNFNSTKIRVGEYLNYFSGRYRSKFEVAIRERIEKEIEAFGFNPENNESKILMEKAIEFLKNENEYNNYIHNLKMVVGNDYNTYDKIGLLCSLFPLYDRHLVVEEKKKEIKSEADTSEYVGSIGERITIENPEEVKVISSFETMYGITFIHKIKDTNGNVFIWKSTSGKYDDYNITKIIGTVKDHSEFRNVKQTVITRCRVTKG